MIWLALALAAASILLWLSFVIVAVYLILRSRPYQETARAALRMFGPPA